MGGAAILAAENRNQKAAIKGKKFIVPLVKKRLRVFVVSYNVLASANRAEEENPCAIIIIMVPSQPQMEFDIRPATSKPIWPTDEYAIRDFISGCRIQMVLVTTAPHIAVEQIKGRNRLLACTDKEAKRRIPYLPSLRRIAAKIIDPATGASTWALGSHRWTRYSGSLTKKAKIIKNHQKYVKGLTVSQNILRKEEVKLRLPVMRIHINRGREAITV